MTTLIREAVRELLMLATIAELIIIGACLIAPACILFWGE